MIICGWKISHVRNIATQGAKFGEVAILVEPVSVIIRPGCHLIYLTSLVY